MWATTSSGKIELQITLKQATAAAHQGQCDLDVQDLSNVPAIRRQLKKIDKDVLISELLEYGSWEVEELQDHEANLQRILWLLCWDIIEEHNAKRSGK